MYHIMGGGEGVNNCVAIMLMYLIELAYISTQHQHVIIIIIIIIIIQNIQ